MPSSPSQKTEFCSQAGGRSVINYSYTDLPWRLLGYDVYYFFHFFKFIPYILLPANKPLSGSMSELALTRQNVFCIALHILLCILQLIFILCLPLAALLPGWVSALAVGAFLLLNSLFCKLLNGKAETYWSDPEYAPRLEKHADEQWIFLNGVAVGQHWLQNNLNRLALTFKRPILGIHNKTDGILFDVVECLAQRTFGYATSDVRLCYSIVKEKLYDPKIKKLVFILHSQGGIEGGMVLDWLLQELPQDLLAKLEVYTFGNAANHFNNPHRHISSERNMAANGADGEHGHGDQPNGVNGARSSSSGQRVARLARETSAHEPSAVTDRAIGHVEHYAHTTDFVALWGVLHFATSAVASPSMPRFIGRVFARTSARGGHQFCHHYLDGMFPLARDESAPGGFGCCLEAGPADDGLNEFMDSEVAVDAAADQCAEVRDAYEAGRMGGGGAGGGSLAAAAGQTLERVGTLPRAAAAAAGTGAATNATGSGAGAEVTVHSTSPVISRQGTMARAIKVKHLSRLWQYRDGRVPEDTAASLGKKN